MDQDGDTDVLGSAFYDDEITWWENADGSGLNWHENVIDNNFDGARDVCTSDMDGDGDPDIIGAAQEGADISWWDVTCCVGAGELVSSILETETGAQWDSLSWNSNEPAGTSIYFQVRSSMDPLYMGNWSTDITVPGSLNNYLMDGDQYVQYKVLLETTNPGVSPVLEDVTISWTEFVGIDVSENFTTPTSFLLYPNFPNPSCEISSIKYQVPVSSHVRLNIYDVRGEEIKTLVNEMQVTGEYTLQFNGSDLPAGIYLVRLQVGGVVETAKMIVLK